MAHVARRRDSWWDEPGSLYAFHSVTGGKIKVGYSQWPEDRHRRLQYEHGPLVVLFVCPGTRRDELKAHDVLAGDALGGEWFSASQRVLSLLAAVARGCPQPAADSVDNTPNAVDNFSPSTAPAASSVDK